MWRLPGFLYADGLALCGESEKDLKATVGLFLLCRRGGQKVNVGKSKAMVLGGEEGMEREVYVDGMRLSLASEFKYLGCVLDESDTDEAECRRKVAGGRRAAGAVKYLVNA